MWRSISSFGENLSYKRLINIRKELEVIPEVILLGAMQPHSVSQSLKNHCKQRANFRFSSQLLHQCVRNCDGFSCIESFTLSLNILYFISSLQDLALLQLQTLLQTRKGTNPICLIAQLVEHSIGIAEFMGSSPVQA